MGLDPEIVSQEAIQQWRHARRRYWFRSLGGLVVYLLALGVIEYFHQWLVAVVVAVVGAVILYPLMKRPNQETDAAARRLQQEVTAWREKRQHS